MLLDAIADVLVVVEPEPVEAPVEPVPVVPEAPPFPDDPVLVVPVPEGVPPVAEEAEAPPDPMFGPSPVHAVSAAAASTDARAPRTRPAVN